jgi:hypothetical protein
MAGSMVRSMIGSVMGWRRLAAVWMLAAGMILALGTGPSMAQSRAHVYLLRGLLNVFSLGMDTLAQELNQRGVYATVHNHTEWQSLADQAAANYKAGKEGPIIIIGHSLGADAVMEMSAYLGQRGVPVALAVPFDGTQSFAASGNIARLVNLTQRDYAFMRKGANFKGSLVNVDVRSDPSIDHLNIDKSPRLHARVISEVLSVVGSHRMPAPGTTVPRPTPVNSPQLNAPSGGAPSAPAKPEVTPAAPAPAAPAKTGSGAMNSMALKPVADSGTPVIALPERGAPPARNPSAPVSTAGQVPN